MGRTKTGESLIIPGLKMGGRSSRYSIFANVWSVRLLSAPELCFRPELPITAEPIGDCFTRSCSTSVTVNVVTNARPCRLTCIETASSCSVVSPTKKYHVALASSASSGAQAVQVWCCLVDAGLPRLSFCTFREGLRKSVPNPAVSHPGPSRQSRAPQHPGRECR